MFKGELNRGHITGCIARNGIKHVYANPFFTQFLIPFVKNQCLKVGANVTMSVAIFVQQPVSLTS